MDFDGVTESILNNKYYPILRKIQIASKADIGDNEYSYSYEDGEECVNQNNESVKYKGDYLNKMTYSGNIECSEFFEIDGTYGFKGMIKEGKPIDGSGYKFAQEIIDNEYVNEDYNGDT